MKKLFAILIIFLASFSVYAQEHNAVHTSVEKGRYEIIQSSIKRSLTFRLDKQNGQVFQLVKRRDGSVTWERMFKDVSPFDKDYNEGLNFQIFMGGIAAADCYLIDVNIGTTWVLVEEKDGSVFWQTM